MPEMPEVQAHAERLTEQFAGRVGLFLEVDDARAEVARLEALGVEFRRPLTEHEYGLAGR